MRKAITILLALALTATLTACGGGNDTPSGNTSTTPPPTSTSDSNTPSSTPTESGKTETPAADTGTVAGFLALFGLTEADITPENFIEFGELKTKGKVGSREYSGLIEIAADKDATGEEQVNAWFQKFYDKLKGLSSDGKLYTDYKTYDKESTLDALFGSPLWGEFPGATWSYQYTSASGNIDSINILTNYHYETGLYDISFIVSRFKSKSTLEGTGGADLSKYTAVEMPKLEFVKDWMLPADGVLTDVFILGSTSRTFRIGGLYDATYDKYLASLVDNGMKVITKTDTFMGVNVYENDTVRIKIPTELSEKDKDGFVYTYLDFTITDIR
jgi:hypothetical protein